MASSKDEQFYSRLPENHISLNDLFASILTLIGNWFASVMGYLYLRTARRKTYLNSLVEMSDTLVIDGKISTVISGTESQRMALQKVLDDMESNNEILYGLYVSADSVMSCYPIYIQINFSTVIGNSLTRFPVA